MQFTLPSRNRNALESPSNTRASICFVNDYSLSSMRNFAPAADIERMEDVPKKQIAEKPHSVKAAFLASLGTRLLGREKTTTVTTESHLTASPPVANNEAATKRPHSMPSRPKTQVLAMPPPMPDLDRLHIRGVDDLEVAFPTDRHQKKKKEIKNEKKSREKRDTTDKGKKGKEGIEKKERRKIFQSLSDEKVPDEYKFKNRKTKINFIKEKFESFDRDVSSTHSSSSVHGMMGDSSNKDGRKLSGFSSSVDDLSDDNFVKGLIYFAPASESTIRELVQQR
jgi:hypothetical protein